MVFKSVKELENYFLKKSRLAIIKAQDKIYTIIKRFVYEYYSEYDPVLYERTYQLLRSLVQTRVVSTGKGYTAEVYFDIDNLNYITGAQPSGEQVMKAAEFGRHGAMGLAVADFKGTSIWHEPLKILNTEAISILKKMLISEGIPIK